MSSNPSEDELVQAVLQTIDNGAYPESEGIASAELPVGVLPKLLDAVNQARSNTEIRDVSRSAAPDIDGWITQAKQLQVEIEHSKAVARDIVQQAQAGQNLRAEHHDASNKVALLREEVAFNEHLSEMMERINLIKKVLQEAETALDTGKLLEGIESVVQAHKRIADLEGHQESRRYAAMIQEKASKLRTVAADTARECWRNMVVVADNKLTFEREAEGKFNPGRPVD
ncbi:hypothetical protein LTS18_014050 [Coniosporium uncinatum]|uniref:Uncharacterized protein n=1 Tax=Coniosporium uncinatum TaxID=93489 RepID=A0ACC3CWA4_9PEZI|nr:hypothetical protein LTS18_014050 [Coniosporium uncinatum]